MNQKNPIFSNLGVGEARIENHIVGSINPSKIDDFETNFGTDFGIDLGAGYIESEEVIPSSISFKDGKGVVTLDAKVLRRLLEMVADKYPQDFL